MAMALDTRSTINEDGPVATIIEKKGFKQDIRELLNKLFTVKNYWNQVKLSQLNDITDIFDKEPHHQVACLLIDAGKVLKNIGLQFKGALGLKKGKSKDKARDSRTINTLCYLLVDFVLAELVQFVNP